MVRVTIRWLVEFCISASLILYFASKVFASLYRLGAGLTGMAQLIINDNRIWYPVLVACPKTRDGKHVGFPNLLPQNESVLENITYTEIANNG